ncbi:MAG: hypothetical protein COY40_04495 [Alphaproteobacteria bacterium CG_4_10_14_0_8_um_filter_53_9]|nr:MAG: hypothetical protein COY40_04495 [Alphaproteobacteria bacterium CG_4_10_14_0_8_um_filter_53_9]
MRLATWMSDAAYRFICGLTATGWVLLLLIVPAGLVYFGSMLPPWVFKALGLTLTALMVFGALWMTISELRDNWRATAEGTDVPPSLTARVKKLRESMAFNRKRDKQTFKAVWTDVWRTLLALASSMKEHKILSGIIILMILLELGNLAALSLWTPHRDVANFSDHIFLHVGIGVLHLMYQVFGAFVIYLTWAFLDREIESSRFGIAFAGMIPVAWSGVLGYVHFGVNGMILCTMAASMALAALLGMVFKCRVSLPEFIREQMPRT